MGIYAIRLPDVGEGIAEAELTEWHVKPGDIVKEDDVLAAVMTDKAAVEVPSSVEGKVVELGGEIGDMLAIGSVLVRIEVDGDGNEDASAPEASKPTPAPKEDKPPAGLGVQGLFDCSREACCTCEMGGSVCFTAAGKHFAYTKWVAVSVSLLPE